MKKKTGVLGQSRKGSNDWPCHMLWKEVLMSIISHPWPDIYWTFWFSYILKYWFDSLLLIFFISNFVCFYCGWFHGGVFKHSTSNLSWFDWHVHFFPKKKNSVSSILKYLKSQICVTLNRHKNQIQSRCLEVLQIGLNPFMLWLKLQPV